MVGAREIHPEPCTDVVHDEDGAGIVAEFADLCPEILRREGVVGKVAVHVRLGDDRGDLVLVVLERLSELVIVVPVDIDIVFHVFRDDAGVVDLLGPGRYTVVIALEEDDLLAVGMRSRAHDGAGCGVVSVLGKECPVSGCDGVDQQVGEIDHDGVRQRGAVRDGPLSCRGLIDIGVVVPEDVGAVRAHVVDEPVAVEVPEIASLSFLGIERERFDGDVAAFRGTLVAVNAGGDHFAGMSERFPALREFINFMHDLSSFTSNRVRLCRGCG